MRSPCQKSLTAFAATIVAASSLAQEAGGLPLWEIGAVGVGVAQQAYPGASARVNTGLLLPYLIYRGEYLRADRSGVELRAVKTPKFELDIGFAGAFGASSDDIEVRRGMPDLGTLGQFGPRVKWHLGAGPMQGKWRAQFPLRGVFDLNDHLAYKGMAFEPELIFERSGLGGWNYNASIGAVWGNRQLADTYYGVAPIYATPQRAAYVADSGIINWRLWGGFWRDLSPDLRLFGFARLDSVGGTANASSPLVQQQNGVSVGLGFTYTWKRSDRRAAD
jgi:outer membrane scaffolding protein for murein synthesis (MipA/OmpV family)